MYVTVLHIISILMHLFNGKLKMHSM